MEAELHYGGQTYRLSGGANGADQVIRESRAYIGQGGGTLEVETTRGLLSVVVSQTIPLAVLKLDE